MLVLAEILPGSPCHYDYTFSADEDQCNYGNFHSYTFELLPIKYLLKILLQTMVNLSFTSFFPPKMETGNLVYRMSLRRHVRWHHDLTAQIFISTIFVGAASTRDCLRPCRGFSANNENCIFELWGSGKGGRFVCWGKRSQNRWEWEWTSFT